MKNYRINGGKNCFGLRMMNKTLAIVLFATILWSPWWTTYTGGGHELETGWNMIGWYQNYNTTASDLAIPFTTMVSKWNATEQTYDTYIVGGPPSFNFEIVQGMGLFVYVTQDTIWSGM